MVGHSPTLQILVHRRLIKMIVELFPWALRALRGRKNPRLPHETVCPLGGKTVISRGKSTSFFAKQMESLNFSDGFDILPDAVLGNP
jgi:hypothetical protein